MPKHSERPLTLPDVVDLELRLAADRDADPAALRRREAQVAQRLAAAGVDPRQNTGPQLFLAWLNELRELEGVAAESTPGHQAERMLAGIGLTLAISGLLLGLSVAGGWLLQAGGRPINVIFFLAAVIGAQMPLLLLWLVAIVPTGCLRRVPGARGVFWLWSQLAQVPPRIIGWVVARVSRDTGQLLGRLRGEVGRMSWIYGPLRLWLLVRLTQVFAVAFNLGVIAGFVLLSYGSDPAFGWKSTLMTENQLHSATRVIAAPWSWLPRDWAAAPTLDDVRASRYWSSAEKVDRGVHDPWSRWWPFLFATLVCYGLLPRLVTLSISQVQVARSLRAIRLDHSEFDRLAERLARPLIDTRATEPELDNGRLRQEDRKLGEVGASLTGSGPVAVLVWSGAELPRPEIERLVTARVGGNVTDVQPVGGLDPAQDTQAIAQIAGQLGHDMAGRAALVVEVWEPPVGDYVDFLAALRSALGRSRLIYVLLFDRNAAGQTVVARPLAAQIWHNRLAQIGDPWLRVESLVEPAREGVT